MVARHRIQRNSDRDSRRLRVLAAGVLAVFAVMASRLFFIQVIAHEFYKEKADDQHLRTSLQVAGRGEIFARDHTGIGSDETYPLAVNRLFYEVSIDPSKITRPINTAQALSDILGVSYEDVLRRAKKSGDIYEPIYSRATDEQKEQIVATGLEGVQFVERTLRFYPDQSVGSHILGFYSLAGEKAAGAYGLEAYWEDELAGSSREVVYALDAQQERLPLDSNVALEHGSDLFLTIDRTIQYEVCGVLERGIERYAADKGSVIIMDPMSGKVLAMCGYPTFDPNEYGKVSDIQNFNNAAVLDAYEPGSVFKSIAMAIAVDQGKVTPSTTYEDTGEVHLKGEKKPIRNHDKKAHGIKTMTEVLQESLNTGIVYATRDVSSDLFREYVRRFGFGERTGIDISQESAGSLGDLARTDRPNAKAYASFGQGITVTAVQMLSAVNAIANGGVLMKPYLVEEIRRADGSAARTSPVQVRRVIQEETAKTLTAMLIKVAEDGYDRKAYVPGYYLAGKTGTAQVAERGSYGEKTDHTFVGFGPAHAPRFSVLIRMHNVKNVAFAADSTTPLFNEIARFLLDYYKIPPER